MNFSELDFSFIADQNVRQVLEDDYRQALLGYDAQAYLGSIVACGAVLEGLLTWALLQRETAAKAHPKAGKNGGSVLAITSWNLTSLLLVAVDLNLVGDMAEHGAWAVKEFRNLIHPYNLVATSTRPDQNLTINALSSLAEIHRSIRKRFVS